MNTARCLESITLSVKDWIEVPDCPIQRNTERHAAKSRNRHLKTKSITQARCSMAEVKKTGDWYKLDGHTRALLWDDGSLEPPEEVLVDIYYVSSLDEVKDLYKHFDTQSSAETATDKLFGAYRLHDFTPESSLLSSARLNSTLSMLTRKHHGAVNLKAKAAFDIYTDIRPFMNYIRMIDKRLYGQKNFPTPVLAALFITLVIDGSNAFRFWTRYENDEGEKRAGRKDGVQCLTEAVDQFRAEKKLSTKAFWGDLAGKAMSAYEGWKSGQEYTHGVRAKDFDAYIDRHFKPRAKR